MKAEISIIYTLLGVLTIAHDLLAMENNKFPLGKPGSTLSYRSTINEVPGSTIERFDLVLGDVEEKNGTLYQWLFLHAEKGNKLGFSIAMLCSKYPSKLAEEAQKEIVRYILSDSQNNSLEYLHKRQKTSILPSTGAWEYLVPRIKNENNPCRLPAQEVHFLGHVFKLEKHHHANITSVPEEINKIKLRPELLIGVPHNKKIKNGTRRYDESDYEYIPLTRQNYFEMMEAGMNCFYVNTEDAKWLSNENVYYWGVGGEDLTYPECLYKSNYLGQMFFFDEPMVGTRDYVIKPKLQSDPNYGKSLTPQIIFEEFRNTFHDKKYKFGPTALLKGLSEREDVDIGEMDFLQENMYTWETMPSSGLYQLSEGKARTPSAIVFEPPGRFGSRRVLPELNMCFDCQIPIDNPKNLTGLIFSFLRGAARVSGKTWGTSVYGQVDRADAYWMMTEAYDLGATHFFYWDNYQLAAVPYNEYVAISNYLSKHADLYPNRDLKKLKTNAEIAFLIPKGYNLGHVKMGLGSISGLPQLNMERKNNFGIKYREVMNNFLVEVERCIRLGVEYDSYWSLDNLELVGYREIIEIKENGNIEVNRNGKIEILHSARKPERPEGNPPGLLVKVKQSEEVFPSTITVTADLTEGSAPVYYTMGADDKGIYNNQYVIWELFGPEYEDYSDLWNDRWKVLVSEEGGSAKVVLKFRINKQGNYKLRAAASDVAGRSTVVWKNINIIHQ